MKPNVKAFVSDALIKMIENKVWIDLTRTKKVIIQGGLKCNGYFDQPLHFKVAMAKSQKDWLKIFTHEYCHFQQCIEKSKIWTDCDATNGIEDYDNWIEHKAELTPTQLKGCTRALQALELDCEQRVVSLIGLYQLPFDAELYVQRANAYVLFYNYVAKHRVWSTTISPYQPQEVLVTVPNKWMKSYKNMTSGYEDAITKYVIEEGMKKK